MLSRKQEGFSANSGLLVVLVDEQNEQESPDGSKEKIGFSSHLGETGKAIQLLEIIKCYIQNLSLKPR
ncbi:hypothetical protein L1987_48812 [Smallanthus sonchifolius]|uniref:Uncharacterized protein n=1 Tax=Smallanthus sonchifolius TaxID=185202 RepID=A0ACB9FSC2_9ASTR|nr:hypothetical protein L1987_48812 [Smallanthus sonchifolius]